MLMYPSLLCPYLCLHCHMLIRFISPHIKVSLIIMSLSLLRGDKYRLLHGLFHIGPGIIPRLPYQPKAIAGWLIWVEGWYQDRNVDIHAIVSTIQNYENRTVTAISDNSNKVQSTVTNNKTIVPILIICAINKYCQIFLNIWVWQSVIPGLCIMGIKWITVCWIVLLLVTVEWKT
jgi:hypothetical protein